MAMTNYEKGKFRFSETFNNDSGKTSGSGMVGVFMGLAATLAFLIAMIGWWMAKPDVLEIMDRILQMGLLSAALMGVRKIVSELKSNKGVTTLETKEEKKKEEKKEVDPGEVV